MQEEKITTKSGVELKVEKRIGENAIEVALWMEKSGDCVLHWGVRRHPGAPWQMPPQSTWPEGSRPFEGAVQTPFVRENGTGRVRLRVDRPANFSIIDFVLFFPDQSRWDNNDGQNYHILLPKREKSAPSPLEMLQKETDPEKVVYKRPYTLETGDQLAVAVVNDEKACRVSLAADTAERPILHWGVARRHRHEWFLPPTTMRPPGTSVFQGKAAETPFSRQGDYWRFSLELKEDLPLGIPFVLKLADSDQWLKDAGKNFYVPLAPPPDYGAELGVHDALAQEIIEKEMSRNSWTLMHRFNLCYDLLDRVAAGDADGLALIFVWLRFSALRQLDWQRNYNTKPRELGHAQDRLTLKLADRYRREERDREWIRLIMTTLGRGSDAQRVRDEVLNIMHRRHIKEVSGHFMEEWHQKLHNNTTPDDIVLCEAFLAFLRSDGNLDVFYNTLNEGGVTKQRLESYERPIKSDPDFIPHLKDALIHDFEHFLRILKEVHSGADLETAVNACRRLFDQETHDRMDFLLAHRDGRQTSVEEIAEKIAEARGRLKDGRESNGEATRDLLFLDLALEDFLRVSVERNLHLDLGEDELLRWVSPILKNLILSHREDELTICLRHWEGLEKAPHREREWSMQAQAVVDRLQRNMGAFIDRYYRMLQPKAEVLGRAFGAEPWTVRLFSEEVVRGRAPFSLSALIRRLAPLLREGAGLGDWQVISRSLAQGEIRSVSTLRAIQEQRFERAAVIVAEKVGGDEEIPEGVTAVITPDAVDIVSHLAIRARNAGLLFAVCYDADQIERLKAMEGRAVRLSVSPGGDVLAEETTLARGEPSERRRRMSAPLSRPRFSAYALRLAEFNEESLGGKSNNLKRLKGRLPEWINLPSSAAAPFRVFERVLSMPENREVADQYERLTQEIDRKEAKERSAGLQKIREVVLGLKAPDELIDALRTAMETEGLVWPKRWEDVWMPVKRVWASKWNERAYLSRLANGIRHEDLFMAVLIQQVVEAEYSFVIHTVHPFTGNRDELYAEAVVGLGETLVGNYPGKALSFSAAKGKGETRLLSFPSKSVGLFGSGLIFRSDSNGEDLAEYAGAGLYDSFMLRPAEKRLLDYSQEKLIRDEGFRERLLAAVSRIGETVEEIMGFPQDIEGAYSNDRFYVVQTRPQVGLQDA